ncbi:YqhR family membrane protein [Bacillus thermotolerans]|uniref:YqhR family membrane protein n=1 Tax=Bacillus thermotolerans TaxID=1221996 RepID=UPI00058342E5|nr:YqhR family membrane protein [Bacillus thermotolerans]KKB37259.1 hypothetical protein QY97_00424 [Bacillus thermotolerans]
MERGKAKETEASFPLSYALTIGLFGGIIWSVVAQLAAYFHFMTFDINAIVEYVNIPKLHSGFYKVLAGIIFHTILSLIVAAAYYFFLKQSKTIWTSILFGIGVWAVFFILLSPLFPSLPFWLEMSRDTLSTSLSLFALYGLFIGYSISYGYERHLLKEKRMNWGNANG